MGNSTKYFAKNGEKSEFPSPTFNNFLPVNISATYNWWDKPSNPF